MAIKFVAVTFFFQLVVMFPIHITDTGDWGLPNPLPAGNKTSNDTARYAYQMTLFRNSDLIAMANMDEKTREPSERMLWLYVFFVYLFSALALYLIITETKNIIRIRQDYLGSQSTVTDRTIRLSGIPEELRSENMIKETIESLQIGKVESVLLCKDWREVDDLMAKRKSVLRKLEEAWTTHLGASGQSQYEAAAHQSTELGSNGDGETARLLDAGVTKDGSEPRPRTRIWYGFMNLQSRKIDAIDYYEENLRKLDERINSSRNKVFKPMPLAFVTLDSAAAAVSLCLQMTAQ